MIVVLPQEVFHRLVELARDVPFSEVRNYLPELVSEWPRVGIVKDRKVVHAFHERTTQERKRFCWLCACTHCQLTAHHIASGGRKSDEQTNLLLCCPGCHDRVQSSRDALPEVLRAKLKHDPEFTNPLRLTLLVGRWIEEAGA